MNRSTPRHFRPGAKHRQDALAADMSRLVRRAFARNLARLGADAGDHAALVIERSQTPIAPAQMAETHPGAAVARAQARELYERCLAHYRSVVRAGDLERDIDDVGAAIAGFVAANIHALHLLDGRPLKITSKMLLRLERQLTAILHAAAAWKQATAVERQFYFEQMAILSVLIAETAAYAPAQGPDAVANVRRAARNYLQDLLGVEPSLLTIGPDGLTVADAGDTGDTAPVAPTVD